VCRLLEDPALIQAEIQRRLQTLRVAHPASQRRDGLQRELVRARHALERLIEAYQEQLITLEELRARTPALRKRETTMQAELDALDTELHDAESYLKLTETLESFRARIGTETGSALMSRSRLSASSRHSSPRRRARGGSARRSSARSATGSPTSSPARPWLATSTRTHSLPTRAISRPPVVAVGARRRRRPRACICR
jgi:hypothetical protein